MSEYLYRILEMKKGSDEWKPEKFYTGGWAFKTYERAIALRDKLVKICTDADFKVQQIIETGV